MGDVLTVRERDRQQAIPEPRDNEHAEKSQMRWENQRKRQHKSKQENDSGGEKLGFVKACTCQQGRVGVFF